MNFLKRFFHSQFSDIQAANNAASTCIPLLYGAMIGDVVGSKYEFHNIRHKDFPLFSKGCSFTDDTVMTVAVANALLNTKTRAELPAAMVEEMQLLGRKYPFPQGGYGGRFASWLRSHDPQPYRSFGNGSAMRVSACAIYAGTLEEALELAAVSAAVTHDHPEGIKGAQATAAAIYLAINGSSREEIRAYTEAHFYPLRESIDEIRRTYTFNETCQGTVPQSIIAFLESESFEDAIRNAVSIGGDTDTVAAITGSIAWPFYLRSGETAAESWIKAVNAYLPQEFIDTAVRLESAKDRY